MTISTMAKTTHFVLNNGDRGDEVKNLQVLLNKFYCDNLLMVDGIFGPDTKFHLSWFQDDCGMGVDGVVRQKTWAYLEEIVPYAQVSHSTLQRGSAGSEVKYLQVRLNEHSRKSHVNYTKIKVDGIFDAQTQLRVKQLQRNLGLASHGIVDSQTWNALEKVDFISPANLRHGDQGEAVKEVQYILNITGYGTLVVDGIFGTLTEATVKRFQLDYGLKTDGIVNTPTWITLLTMDHTKAWTVQSYGSLKLVFCAKAQTFEEVG